MNNLLKKLMFWKKEEPITFPSRFALVRLTKQAKDKGIMDNENKIIEIYKNGELQSSMPYGKETVNAIEEVYEIPVVDEVFEDEQFEFEEGPDFGSAQFKK